MGSTTDIEVLDNTTIVHKSEFDRIIFEYCELHKLKEDDIPPLIWVDILMEIYEQVFMLNKEYLHTLHGVGNEYNIEKVLYYYNIYKRLSLSHNQEVSQKGFLTFSGIDKQTIYNLSERVGSPIFDFSKKIMDDNRESLEKLMQDKRYNPMKFLPKLNRYHGYNMSGVRENSQKTSLEFSQLPSLNCSNSTNNLLPDGTNNE